MLTWTKIGSDQAFGEARDGQKSNYELESSGIKLLLYFLDYNLKTRSFRGLRSVMWFLNLVK